MDENQPRNLALPPLSLSPAQPPNAICLTLYLKTTTGKVTDWVVPSDKSGEFKRQVSSFRECISKEPGARFPPEKGRYHLYISYACPWVCPVLPLLLLPLAFVPRDPLTC